VQATLAIVRCVPVSLFEERASLSRQLLRRLGESFLWFVKWAVAPVILGALVIAGGVYFYRKGIDFDTFLNYFALGLLIFVIITLLYGIIAIHDVPYEIAHRRDHPHQDAIHAAGWVSLFTLHALWPFLWIWAMLYRPERGWALPTGQLPSPRSRARWTISSGGCRSLSHARSSRR
jgi:hypothetical protein